MLSLVMDHGCSLVTSDHSSLGVCGQYAWLSVVIPPSEPGSQSVHGYKRLFLLSEVGSLVPHWFFLSLDYVVTGQSSVCSIGYFSPEPRGYSPVTIGYKKLSLLLNHRGSLVPEIICLWTTLVFGYH